MSRPVGRFSGGRGRQGQLRRLRSGIGAGSAVAAFLAYGMTPMAHADIADDVLDGIVAAAEASAAPGFGAADIDWSDPLGAFDVAVADWYHDVFYLPLHDLVADFIDQNEQLLSLINAPFIELFGRSLIGDGIDGFTGANESILGRSGLFGDLGDGGFLFGDGGTGAAGVDGAAGSVGGMAGMFGNGGAGGIGAAAAAGGAGGRRRVAVR